jgi:hypothetical protein
MSQIQINPNQYQQTPNGGSYYSPLDNPSWALDFRMLALSQNDRLDISANLCYEGLLCYQQDVNTYYVYINTGSANYQNAPNPRTNTVNDWVELGEFLGGTGAAPPDMAVQFNSASKFSGSADFVYNYQTQRVGIGLSIPTAKLDLLGSFQQGGLGLMAVGTGSHAQGQYTLASGAYSHTEGEYTTASGDYSHAAGNSTIALGNYQSVIGQYNLPMGTSGSFIIGRGSLGSQKNLVYTSGSHFEITGSLYLTESRNELQEFYLMYNTQSGEVTYSNLSQPPPPCMTWKIEDRGAHDTYEYYDCNDTLQTWESSGGPNDVVYVCSKNSPYPLDPLNSLYYIALYDSTGCNIPPLLPIIETASISGNVKYDNTAQTPMTNTTVRLLNSNGTHVTSVITNGSGDFNFGGNIPTGSYYIDFYTNKPLSGINATDALLISRHFANTQLLTGIRKLAADVNASNTITSTDPFQVNQRSTSQRSSFNAGDWVFGTTATDTTFRGWFMVNQPQLGSTPNPNGITSSLNGAVSSIGIPLTASRGDINLQYLALSVGDVNGSYNPNVNL